ncbi:hypothetical protein L7F22_011799 [Adiantum nelumboides]|nr:hypothetical protein [Adiantum nelumboides]
MAEAPATRCCSCSERRGTSFRDPEPRAATEEEEAWLQWEDQILQAMVVPASPSPSRDAEVFNVNDELAQWRQAELQSHAIEEVELICGLEEQKEQQLLELVNSENVHDYLMMRSLINGASYLTDAKSLEEADIQDLIFVQQSAKALLQLVDDNVRARMEEECLKALEQYNKIMVSQKEIEATAARDKALLKAEISKLKKDCRDLNEKFEQEKDRTTCRICFLKPRDVLPLPCMHFDYCHSCLHQYQKMRNICPTCRSPISGVLRHNLSIG